LTAEENVLLPFELTGGKRSSDAPARGSCSKRRAADRRTIIRCSSRAVTAARRLARAFMVRPPILLADEPTQSRQQNGQHILELLISLNKREGTTLVW